MISRKDSLVGDLLREVRKAFVSRRDQEESEVVDVRLIHKGKVLLPNSRLEEAGVQTGDSLVASIRRRPVDVAVPAAAAAAVSTPTPAAAAKDDSGHVQEMMQFLEKQQAHLRELQEGWQAALLAITSQQSVQSDEGKQADLLLRIDSK